MQSYIVLAGYNLLGWSGQRIQMHHSKKNKNKKLMNTVAKFFELTKNYFDIWLTPIFYL
jgi:hypothetical protein